MKGERNDRDDPEQEFTEMTWESRFLLCIVIHPLASEPQGRHCHDITKHPRHCDA